MEKGQGAEMILYESKSGKVEWLEKEKIVVKTFSGYITGDELRDAFKSGYHKMKETGGVKWLSDNRGLPTYRIEDVDWINNEWFPRMLKIGWKYWALIEPESNVGLLVMKKFKFFTDQGIQLNVFNSVKDGVRWLDKQS